MVSMADERQRAREPALDRPSAGGDPDEIDLAQLVRVLQDRWHLVALPMVVAMGLAMLYLVVKPPVYEAMGELLVEETSPTPRDVMLDGQTAGRPIGTHRALIESPLVLKRAADLLEQWGHSEIAQDLLSPTAEERVRATPADRESRNIIEVRVRGATPEAAQLGALAVLRAYEQFVLEEIRSGGSKAAEFLEQQLERATEGWQQAQEALNAFQQKRGIVSFEDEVRRVNEQLGTLERELAQTAIDLESREQVMKELEAQLAAEATRLPAVTVHPVQRLMEELQKRLAELETQRTDYLARGLQPTDPEVRLVDRQIQGLQERLERLGQSAATDPAALQGAGVYQGLMVRRAQLETEISELRHRADLLRERIAAQQQRLRSLLEAGQELARLQRDVEVAANTSRVLREELERARITEGSKVSTVRILREPGLPQQPVEPKPLLTLAVAGMLGGFCGVGLVFYRELVDRGVRGTEQIQELGVRTLGLVPLLDAADLTLVHAEWHPGSPLVQSLTRVETGLRFLDLQPPPRVLGITSAIPGEGKSTVAMNLAYLLSRVGERVLLVDCDLVHPGLHEVLAVAPSPGLTDALAERVSLEEAIRFPFAGEAARLGIMTAGSPGPSGGPLFRGEALPGALACLRAAYDWIIVDLPPVNAVPESVQLARRLDGVVLIIRERVAPLGAVRKTVEQLRVAGARVLGAVLNGTRSESWERYPYYYHYYAHHSPERTAPQGQQARRRAMSRVLTRIRGRRSDLGQGS